MGSGSKIRDLTNIGSVALRLASIVEFVEDDDETASVGTCDEVGSTAVWSSCEGEGQSGSGVSVAKSSSKASLALDGGL